MPGPQEPCQGGRNPRRTDVVLAVAVQHEDEAERGERCDLASDTAKEANEILNSIEILVIQLYAFV